jgi:hypothetical protein
MSLKARLCTPGTQNQGSTAGALHFRRWWQAQQTDTTQPSPFYTREKNKKTWLPLYNSQRIFTEGDISPHPLHTPPKQQLGAWKIPFYCFRVSFLRLETSVKYQYYLGTWDLCCTTRPWTGFGNKCRFLKQEIVVGVWLWPCFRRNYEGWQCKELVSHYI